MMLTDDAVESALAVLRMPRPSSGFADPSGPATAVPRGARSPLSGKVLALVVGASSDRSEEVARARAWLDEGRVPDAAFVANALVGRLVCDRLR